MRLVAENLAAVRGERVVFRDLNFELNAAQALVLHGPNGSGNGVAWPQSCGVVDILDDGLFSRVPYVKGAFFYRAVEQRVGRAMLDAALRKLTVYHDALRAGVARNDAGDWVQTIASPARVGGYRLLECEALDTVDGIAGAVEAALERLRQRIDPATGPLLQATLIDAGSEQPVQVLLLVAHHFAIDPISWAIVLHDLQTIYEQLDAGLPVRLPVKVAKQILSVPTELLQLKVDLSSKEEAIAEVQAAQIATETKLRLLQECLATEIRDGNDGGACIK